MARKLGSLRCGFHQKVKGKTFCSCDKNGESWKPYRAGSACERKWCSTRTDDSCNRLDEVGQYRYCSGGCLGPGTFGRKSSFSLREGEEEKESEFEDQNEHPDEKKYYKETQYEEENKYVGDIENDKEAENKNEVKEGEESGYEWTEDGEEE